MTIQYQLNSHLRKENMYMKYGNKSKQTMHTKNHSRKMQKYALTKLPHCVTF